MVELGSKRYFMVVSGSVGQERCGAVMFGMVEYSYGVAVEVG